MTLEILYNLFDFLCHIQNRYAYYENLYLYYAEEIIFYHFSALSIITWKDWVLVCCFFCIFWEYLVDLFSILVLNSQVLLFAVWFSSQLLHFKTAWEQIWSWILQILQLCWLVLCSSAQIWQIDWAKQTLVEWSNFWQFKHCFLKRRFWYFSAIN
jgi:hypothetical protein